MCHTVNVDLSYICTDNAVKPLKKDYIQQAITENIEIILSVQMGLVEAETKIINNSSNQ